VSDFDEAIKEGILEKLADLAGFVVAPFGSKIEVRAGSVVVVATFPGLTQGQANAAESSLASYSGATGQEDFEEAMSTVLGGISILSPFAVDIVDNEEPTKKSSSTAVVAIVAVAGVAVVAALLVGGYICYKKKDRRARVSVVGQMEGAEPSRRTSKTDLEGAPDGDVDANSGQTPRTSVYRTSDGI